MRRLLVLAVLLAVMLGLSALKTDQVRVHDPMTLAAIGFVMLAAFTVSELGSLLKLPRVTGYILAGVALGPSAANILSSDVVNEMRMFNTLALGLIATSAGLELDLGQLKKVWRTLFATIGAKILFGAVLVGAAMLGTQAVLHVLPLDSSAKVMAMALVLGALSIGTSPAIVLAVLKETQAKGRLSDLVLGAAVLKDLVVVIALAVAIAISRTLLEPGAAMDATVLVDVAEELGSSILAGAILGGLLILYVRYVRAEMLLFVAAMILVVSELGRALHLELLLVFITAGFAVRNLSKYEHALMTPLSLVSLPVFVVFFTNAGASVDLVTTWRILPLAGALCAARALGYFVSARIGGAAGRESAAIRRHAWLAYLPQAGVTLGLVGIAATQIPSLAGPISSTGMAVVALNLLVGPIALRRALRGTGELPDTVADRQTMAPAQPAMRDRKSAPDDLTAAAREASEAADDAIAALEHDGLRAMVEGVRARCDTEVDTFIREQVEPWFSAFESAMMTAMREGPENGASPLEIWLANADREEVLARGKSCRALYSALDRSLHGLAEELTVPMAARHFQVALGDSLGVRMRKRWARGVRLLTLGRRHKRRVVAVRLAARVAAEPTLAASCAQVLTSWCAAEAAVFDELQHFAAGQFDRDQARESVQRVLASSRARVPAELAAHVARATEHLARLLADAGSPTLPASQIRYSAVEPELRESLRHIDEDPPVWAEKLQAARSVPLMSWHLARVDLRLRKTVEEHVFARAREAVLGMLPIVEKVCLGLESCRDSVPAGTTIPEQEVRRLSDACRSLYPDDAEHEVEHSGSQLRPAASLHRVALDLRTTVESLPERLLVLRPNIELHTFPSPREVPTRSVALRELASQELLRSFLPALDERVEKTSSLLARANARIREALNIAITALESHAEMASHGTSDPVEVQRGFERAVARVQEVRDGVAQSEPQLAQEVGGCMVRTFALLHESATGTATIGAVGARRETAVSRAWHRFGDVFSPLQLRLTETRRRAMTTIRRLRRSELSQDIQLRYNKATLDAAAIWDYTRRWQVPPDVPETYARIFSAEPVREHRRFTARHDELKVLLDAERHWLDGGPGSALLIGEQGSGRTSLLNLCELEMTAPRLARPERMRTPRDVGLVAALARELGCRPRMLHVIATLRRTRTIVIIDDLEHWFTPDASGLRDLERFLNLVVRTRDAAFWLISLGEETLGLLEEVFSVRQAFGHVVTLEPLKLEALIHAIESRHQLSGCSAEYPRNIVSRVLGRFPGASDRVMFFRVLASMSDGNLGRALTAWLRSAKVDQDGSVSLEVRRALTRGLPFMAQMSTRDTAILVQLLRFGPMGASQLAASLGLRRDEADRHIAFLTTAGLVEPWMDAGAELRVPPALHAPTVLGLRSVGAWP